MRLALLLVPLVLIAAACGDTVSLDPVAKAATESTKQVSEHMHLTAQVTVGARQVTMSGDGDFRNDPALGQIAVAVNAGGTATTMREVMSGTKVYLSSDLFKDKLPGGKMWLGVDLAKAGKALGVDMSTLSSQSPASTLQQLEATGRVTKVGEESLDGVATTHYTATIDPAKLAKLKRALHVQVTYHAVDVWVDGQNLVRRLHLSYSQTAGNATPASSTDMIITLSHYGEPVDVSVPSDADTYDATASATNAIQNGGTP